MTMTTSAARLPARSLPSGEAWPADGAGRVGRPAPGLLLRRREGDSRAAPGLAAAPGGHSRGRFPRGDVQHRPSETVLVLQRGSEWVLLASRGQRPGMLLTSQCIGQPLTESSGAPGRNPAPAWAALAAGRLQDPAPWSSSRGWRCSLLTAQQPHDVRASGSLLPKLGHKTPASFEMLFRVLLT